MKVLDAISDVAHKNELTLKEHSPEILVVGGVCGLIAAGILACKATTKAPKKVEEVKVRIEEIKEEHEVELIDDKEYKKELAKSYMKLATEMIKMYAPSVILAGLSAAAVFESNDILKKRNASLAAAYASVDGAFKFYRKNVIDKYGAEEDQRLLTGAKQKELVTETIDETGKKKKVKEKVDVVDIYGLSNSYARIYGDFDVDHPMHATSYSCNDRNYNVAFLLGIQNFLNDKLRAYKFVTLNELYEELGYARTKAGQNVGWTLDGSKSDGYIDLRINDKFYYEDEAGNTVRGILIDPNVEGYILDRNDLLPET